MDRELEIKLFPIAEQKYPPLHGNLEKLISENTTKGYLAPSIYCDACKDFYGGRHYPLTTSCQHKLCSNELAGLIKDKKVALETSGFLQPKTDYEIRYSCASCATIKEFFPQGLQGYKPHAPPSRMCPNKLLKLLKEAYFDEAVCKLMVSQLISPAINSFNRQMDKKFLGMRIVEIDQFD